MFARDVERLADKVGDHVRPSLCHRDLHLGNLIADASGGLAAILDFDGAEAWDPVVDFVKLPMISD